MSGKGTEVCRCAAYYRSHTRQVDCYQLCRTCLRLAPEAAFLVVSPTGLAHLDSWTRDGATLCGKDATGDAWRWQL